MVEAVARLPESFRVAVKSSNLTFIAYDGATMEVGFHNGVYQYFNVDQSTWEQLIAAPSVGKQLNLIKHSFPYVRVD